MCTQTHAYICTHTRIHAHTHAHTHTHAYTHICTNTHNVTHTFAQIHTQWHTHTHMHTHILAHTHAQTHIHTPQTEVAGIDKSVMQDAILKATSSQWQQHEDGQPRQPSAAPTSLWRSVPKGQEHGAEERLVRGRQQQQQQLQQQGSQDSEQQQQQQQQQQCNEQQYNEQQQQQQQEERGDESCGSSSRGSEGQEGGARQQQQQQQHEGAASGGLGDGAGDKERGGCSRGVDLGAGVNGCHLAEKTDRDKGEEGKRGMEGEDEGEGLPEAPLDEAEREEVKALLAEENIAMLADEDKEKLTVSVCVCL